jgi:HEAT repeat protein
MHYQTGKEPQLGGNITQHLTGLEPLLGGKRRAAADANRVDLLLNLPSYERRMAILDFVISTGQQETYALELILAIPPRARHKGHNWTGTFTPGQRGRAIEALAVIGSYESIVPLLEALVDANYEIRQAAEKALVMVVERLTPESTRTRDAYRILTYTLRILPLAARKVVARILAAAPPDLVLGPLLRDSLTADDWWARREAAWILGELGDRRATIRLIETLDDPSPTVRQSATWALGQLDAPIALTPLREKLRDRDEVVRATAASALGAQAARLSALDEKFQPIIQWLVEALYDNDSSVRLAALEAIGSINSPQARLALQAAAKNRIT